MMSLNQNLNKFSKIKQWACHVGAWTWAALGCCLKFLFLFYITFAYTYFVFILLFASLFIFFFSFVFRFSFLFYLLTLNLFLAHDYLAFCICARPLCPLDAYRPLWPRPIIKLGPVLAKEEIQKKKNWSKKHNPLSQPKVVKGKVAE